MAAKNIELPPLPTRQAHLVWDTHAWQVKEWKDRGALTEEGQEMLRAVITEKHPLLAVLLAEDDMRRLIQEQTERAVLLLPRLLSQNDATGEALKQLDDYIVIKQKLHPSQWMTLNGFRLWKFPKEDQAPYGRLSVQAGPPSERELEDLHSSGLADSGPIALSPDAPRFFPTSVTMTSSSTRLMTPRCLWTLVGENGVVWGDIQVQVLEYPLYWTAPSVSRSLSISSGGEVPWYKKALISGSNSLAQFMSATGNAATHSGHSSIASLSARGSQIGIVTHLEELHDDIAIVLRAIWPDVDAFVRQYATIKNMMADMVATLWSLKNDDPKSSLKAAMESKLQSFYTKVEQQLKHDLFSVKDLPKAKTSALEWSESEFSDEIDMAVFRMLRKTKEACSPIERIMEWIEVRMTSWPGLYERFMGMADASDADRLHDMELEKQIKELSAQQHPDSPVAEEERVQRALRILEKFHKEQCSDAHASATGALYRQTPIGKALLMFLLYKQLAISTTEVCDSTEEIPAANADDIFPIFVKVMTAALSRQLSDTVTSNELTLYSQVRFVQRYRRSNTVWHGEPGFGLTNVASFVEYVDRQYHPEGRQLFGNVSISPLTSPPSVEVPSKSGIWLLGQVPSHRSTPSPIKRSGSSTFTAATAVVTGFAKTLQTQIKKQANPVDVTRPPIVDRFVNMPSYRDLKLADVEILLDEYKKLAQWSKTVPADMSK